MLKHLSSVYEYREYLKTENQYLDLSCRKRLNSKVFKQAIHKLRKVDVGLVRDVIEPLYSCTGRPAIDPAIMIRSFILMMHLGYLSIKDWSNDLRSDDLLQYLIGSKDVPSFSSHYDFIIRLSGLDPNRNELHKKDYYKKYKVKPKKGEKLINYSHTDTYYLYDRYKDGAQCDRDRFIYNLQALFNYLCVIPSIETGYINTQDMILSGDGSSMHIHASRFGHKVKDGNDDEDLYRYSAPDADIGWDSDLGLYYLGFTFYNIAYHNPDKNIDLPVFIALEKASRNDALTSVSATAQMLDMNKELLPKYMCLDSASDSLPIHQYFNYKRITPVIDHNPSRHQNKKINENEYIDKDGYPVCNGGYRMAYFGYDIQRCRKKFRCPLAMGKIDSCDKKESCSSSAYGRVVYINDGDDVFNSSTLQYRSDKWKKIYKDRTSTERINNRVLNDYHLHQMRIRDGAKHAFFSIFAAINIHLDAWIKDLDK